MNRPRNQGFTLLEILVAIAIFAMFSVMAYGGLMNMLDTQEHLAREQRFWRALDRGLQHMADDLSQARTRPVRDIDGQLLPAFIGRPTDTRALAPPAIEFTRGGLYVLDDAVRADIQRIAYRLDEGRLLRVTWPVLDRSPTSKAAEVAVLNDVQDIKVRFYAASNNWVDEWPAAGAGDVLPRGVEVTLTLRDRGTYQRIFLVNG